MTRRRITRALLGVVLGAVAALAAFALWWRRNPSACPYGLRFLVELPHPFITRGRLREILAPRPGERVLEVGPGAGYYALPMTWWLELGGSLDVPDVQQKMLDHVMRPADRRRRRAVRIGESMRGDSKEEQRHTEARRAWERGDLDSLCKLCDIEIRTAVRKAIGNNPELRGTEGINGELRAFARRGVEKAAKRYKPSEGKFQAYAWQDIYWEARRGAEAISRLRYELHQGPEDVVVEEEPQTLRHQLAAALNSSSTDWWIKRIEDLDRDMLEVLRSFLDASRDELIGEIGDAKYWSVRNHVFLKGLVSALSQPRARFREISGPQRMMILGRVHKRLNPLAPPLSNRQLARMFDRSDKTIKAWKERIEHSGPPPPTLRDDGSLTMKGKDLDDWMLYLASIEDPRFKRRLERRSQNESE